MSKRVPPPTPAATKAPFFAHQWRPLTASPRPLEGMCSFPGRHTETAIRDRKPGAGAPGAPPGPGGVQPGQEGGRLCSQPHKPAKGHIYSPHAGTRSEHASTRLQVPAPDLLRSRVGLGGGVWECLRPPARRPISSSITSLPLRTTNQLPGWRSLLASRSRRPPRRVWEGTCPRLPHLELGDMNINSASVQRTTSQTLLQPVVSS